MLKRILAKTAVTMLILLILTACGTESNENRTVIKEPGKTITVIENENKETGQYSISVEKIEKFEGVEISDWLDEETVIVSKENKSLKKMSLEELSEFYPRSLYLYNLDTKEFKLVNEKEEIFQGGATFSPDKKHLSYYHYSLGDPGYYMMDMDTLEKLSIYDENLGGVFSAEWADNENLIGSAARGGAYLFNINGEMSVIEELEGESFFLVRKIQDKIFYVTMSTAQPELIRLNLATKEKKNLDENNVEAITPSPDMDQMLIIQATGSERALIICDAEGNKVKIIAEGTEITGASWSPDQRMIAYRLKSIVNGTTSSGLYIYDVLTDKSVQIAVDTAGAQTSWSPSGNKLAVAELADNSYNSGSIIINSSIIYLRK